MIPFEFEYYRPDTVREAAEVFRQLDEAGMSPAWYGGGTELITMARVGNRSFGAVIDIKGIPECRMLDDRGDDVLLGAALTLDEIAASGKFPLLGKTAARIADHTVQCKITLGGNLASTIIYREAALPLLLSDAVMTAAGPSGVKRYEIGRVFRERLQLPKGEFLLGAAVGRRFAAAPYFHIKKTKNEKIDYPLLTTAALVDGGRLRVAFSGLAGYPFRDRGVEEILNDGSLRDMEKADAAARALSGIILEDPNGSAAYRRFVLKNTVADLLGAVKEAGIPCMC
jgi:CO/xanthine dehydrogenase FAD-binding subunit